MKKVRISLTYLDTITIDDDKNIDEAVLEFVSMNYQEEYNDLEYEEVKQ